MRLKKVLATVAVLALIGVGVFVERVREQQRDAEKLQAIVQAMGERLKKSDQDYAERIKATGLEAAFGVLGSERITDPAARRAALESFAATIKVIDEAVVRRERIPEDAIREIQAADVDSARKEAMVAGIRSRLGATIPVSLQMMKGTRTFVAKAEETIAHVERYAAGLAMRDGRLEFADPLGSDIYNALQSELTAVQQELRRLKP